MNIRRTIAIVVAVVVLAAAGFAAMRLLNGKPGCQTPAPPTVAAAVVQPNGETIHIVTSLPKPIVKHKKSSSTRSRSSVARDVEPEQVGRAAGLTVGESRRLLAGTRRRLPPRRDRIRPK